MEITFRSKIALILLFAFCLISANAIGEEAGIAALGSPSPDSSSPVYLLIPDVFETSAVYNQPKTGLVQYLENKKRKVFLLDWQAPGKDFTNRSFDDLAERELPGDIELLRKQVGDRPIILVGHGLGGLAALNYAAIAKEPGKPIAIIAIGTPGKFILRNKILDAMIEAEKSYPAGKAIPTSLGAKTPAPLPGATQPVFDILLTNDKNFDPEIRKDYYSSALTPLPRTLVKQWIKWVETGQTKSLDGQVDYYGRLSDVTCPVLFICGKIDNLVDPFESILAKDKIGSTDKEMRIFCIPNGYKSDYGHVGLLLAPNAGREVFPYIYKWAKKRAR